MSRAVPAGTVHPLPNDLRDVVADRPELLARWTALTPLGRNEFICWVEDAKGAATRQRRIMRLVEELLEGRKRPCCWQGCIHRTDKAPSRWQRAVLIDKGRA